MNIVYDGTKETRSLKETISSVIEQLLQDDPDFIYLDADLMNCIGTLALSERYPDRCINVGIAEANLIGVACGLAAAGFKPLVHSFAGFASRRCFDQVFLSAGYANNSITILGTDPGICGALNGGTHMPFEDIGIYSLVPNGTVVDITDSVMLESVLTQFKDMPGVKYLRTHRKNAAKVFERGQDFPIGKAIPLREGSDAVIFASGIMVEEALNAATVLEKEHDLHVAVVNVFTIKPLDVDLVCEYGSKTGVVITAENHNRIGGLHSAISQALSVNCPMYVSCVAVDDSYGEVGPIDYLKKRFNLTSETIVNVTLSAISRKKETCQ